MSQVGGVRSGRGCLLGKRTCLSRPERLLLIIMSFLRGRGGGGEAMGGASVSVSLLLLLLLPEYVHN